MLVTLLVAGHTQPLKGADRSCVVTPCRRWPSREACYRDCLLTLTCGSSARWLVPWERNGDNDDVAQRSKSDVSNAALRIFLQRVGAFYDQARGLEEYRSQRPQKQCLLEFFKHSCCYCGTELTLETMCEDHLVPMNKDALGLHAWGNVVPACNACNKKKHFGSWPTYLHAACRGDKDLLVLRSDRITAFLDRYGYEPKLRLREIAGNLYEDVGAVAMTLVDLRFKQAETVISDIVRAAKSSSAG